MKYHAFMLYCISVNTIYTQPMLDHSPAQLDTSETRHQ